MRRVIALLVLGLFLSGCGKVGAKLEQLWTGEKRKVTIAAKVNAAKGMLTLYRVTEDGWCGTGIEYPGLTGEVMQECDGLDIFTVDGDSTGDLSVLYGLVMDPKVTEVVAVTKSGQKLTATVSNGIWYLVLPGLRTAPEVAHLEGFDSAGVRLHPAPLE